MKVLHINDYPPGDSGGAEVMMAATIALLRDRGVNVDVFTSADLSDARVTPLRYISNPIARRALAVKLDQFQPGVVHLHNFYHVLSPGILATLAAYRRSRPLRVVMTAHDYHLACPNSGGNWFDSKGVMRPVESGRAGSLAAMLGRRWDHRGRAHSMGKVIQHLWNYRLRDRRNVIDTVLCPSRFMQSMLRTAGMPQSKLIHLPHPAPQMHASVSRRGDPLRLVFAGRVEPEKGVEPFLMGIPATFCGRLTIIGDGTRLVACRAIATQRGLAERIDFPGRLTHEQTVQIIQQCHVLVLPSVCLENYPLSLIEALAAGTNILVSDLGGMREIVNDTGVGYPHTPGDAASLAAALDAIDRAHAAGTLNAFDVSEFLRTRNATAHIDQLLAIYRGEAPRLSEVPRR